MKLDKIYEATADRHKQQAEQNCERREMLESSLCSQQPCRMNIVQGVRNKAEQMSYL